MSASNDHHHSTKSLDCSANSGLRHSDHSENHRVHFPDEDGNDSLVIIVGDIDTDTTKDSKTELVDEVQENASFPSGKQRRRRLESPPPLDNGRSTSPTPSHCSRSSSFTNDPDYENSNHNFSTEDDVDKNEYIKASHDDVNGELMPIKRVSFSNKGFPVAIIEDNDTNNTINDECTDRIVTPAIDHP